MNRFLTAMLLFGWAGASLAQQLPVAEQDKPAPAREPATITDEPQTVDPAKQMPPRLAVKGTVTFDGHSLLELAQWFADEHQVTVLFDKSGLDDIGIPLGEPVYDSLEDEPIYLLLGRLKMLGLAWYYEDGLVTVTSADEAESRLTIVPRNLGDLLDAGYDRDRIADVILSTVAAETWAENGGGDSEVQWLGDVLFVSQTDETQRRVAGLIAALRKHARRTFVFDPPQHIDLREKLNEPISLKLEQTPLTLAIEEIAEASGADIRLDKEGASDLGVREREPVSLNLEDRSMRTVLQVALRDLEMTWMLRDGVLWVTSRQKANHHFKTAVYDVRDLCRDAEEGDALIDAIVSQMDVESWAENGGGEAEIRFANDGVMVVSQTEENHQELLSLLERYREALRQSKPREVAGPDPEEVLTRYYRMPSVMATGLADALPKLVARDAWRTPETPNAIGTLLVVPSEDQVEPHKGSPLRVTPHSVLIVKQTRAVHEEIAELIAKVRRGDGFEGASGGFGSGGGGFGGGFF